MWKSAIFVIYFNWSRFALGQEFENLGIGYCRYGYGQSDPNNPITVGSLLLCQNTCKPTECTAVAFNPSSGLCYTYRGGPYTYAEGNNNLLCYVVKGMYSLLDAFVFSNVVKL